MRNDRRGCSAELAGESKNLSTEKAHQFSSKSRAARAVLRANYLAPIIEELRASGVTSLRDIAAALNERGKRARRLAGDASSEGAGAAKLGQVTVEMELTEHTHIDGVAVFRHACAMGLEGIVSKRLSAPYRSGPSRDWIKVKNPDSPAMIRHREGRW
jgi:hypothetical protein